MGAKAIKLGSCDSELKGFSKVASSISFPSFGVYNYNLGAIISQAVFIVG